MSARQAKPRHQCEHPDCERMLPAYKFLCNPHWMQLPLAFRRALNAADVARDEALSAWHQTPAGERPDAPPASYYALAETAEATKAAVVAALHGEWPGPLPGAPAPGRGDGELSRLTEAEAEAAGKLLAKLALAWWRQHEAKGGAL